MRLPAVCRNRGNRISRTNYENGFEMRRNKEVEESESRDLRPLFLR